MEQFKGGNLVNLPERAKAVLDALHGGSPASYAIRFADGSAAAEVTLSGNTISALSLRPRQYSAASSASPLLPLRQAMAIAGRTEGAELSIGYADTGVYPLSAVWLTD